MAKKLTQTAIWEQNAENELGALRKGTRYLCTTSRRFAAVSFLRFLVPWLRETHTDAGRASTYEKVQKKWIRGLMINLGLTEFVSQRSFVMLKPNLQFGSGETASEKYDLLQARYGDDWCAEHITIVDVITEAHIVKVTTIATIAGDGQAKSVQEFIEVPRSEVATYTIPDKEHPEWSVLDKLRWSRVMGNNVTVDVGDISERVKKGQGRNSHKAAA